MKKQKVLHKKFQKETGAGLVEYGLLVALIALVSFTGAKNFFETVSLSLGDTHKHLNAIGGTGCDPKKQFCPPS